MKLLIKRTCRLSSFHGISEELKYKEIKEKRLHKKSIGEKRASISYNTLSESVVLCKPCQTSMTENFFKKEVTARGC